MGNYTSITLTNIKPTILDQGIIILYKHKNFIGQKTDPIKDRKKTYLSDELIKYGLDDKSISSIIIGPNTKVTLYENDNKLGKKLILINRTIDKDYYYGDFRLRTNHFTNWTWDNIVSAVDIKKNNYNILKKIIKNTYDYAVKVVIGGKEYKFDYGSYHNIWLNTNEDDMTVYNIFPEDTRIEFWTGNHVGQGSRILVDRENNKKIMNKGIIRSLQIFRYLTLKKNNNEYNDNNLISKDYQKHIGIRDKQIKYRQIFHKNYNFNENLGTLEFFDNNLKYNNINYIYLIIIFLYFIWKKYKV